MKKIKHFFPKALLTLIYLTINVGFLMAQNIKITGRVLDASSNEPLIGANILIKETQLGVTTDIDGKYELSTDAKNTLVFSYVGYENKEMPIDGQRVIDIKLGENASLINEVVVVGYGTQKKIDVTGAVSSVKSTELAKIPTPSVEQALQGKVSGVQVTAISGKPGEGAVVRVRGVGTLNDANPLYVVDGMIVNDISFLNTNDIERIDVLKDASSTAIYGSRGANGVIMVTTKRGSKKDRSSISFSSYYGNQTLARKIPLANATQYATLSNEIAANEGRPAVFKDVNNLPGNSDWQDLIYQTAPIQNYHIAFDGGGDKYTYNVSGDYFKQEGIVKNSNYDRFTLRINNDYILTPYLKMGHNLALIYSNQTNVPDVTYNTYKADPTVIARDEANNTWGNTGSLSSVANPLAQLFYESNKHQKNYRGVANLYLDIKLLKFLSFRSNVGIDAIFGQVREFTPTFEVSPLQRNTLSSLLNRTDRNRKWLWENYLTFDKSFDMVSLNVVAGVSAQRDFGEFEKTTIKGLKYETDELLYSNFSALEGRTIDNGAEAYSLSSYFGRASLTFLKRYLVTLSFRNDGSSRFGKNYQRGNFPSVGLGWRVIDEPFMQNQTLFSNLKVRASWGRIGNDRIPNYQSLARVATGLYTVFGQNETLKDGATTNSLSNPNLHWETTTQSDIGVEIGLIKDHLTAEIDYYNRLTDGILVRVPIPAYIGSEENPFINAAKVRNSGFDFKIDWRDKKVVGYNIGLVASTVKNNVEELGEGLAQIYDGGLGIGGILGTRTVIGLPIGSFYGYKTAGLFQNAEELKNKPRQGSEVVGDLIFQDLDGDGKITDKDRTNLGNAIPKFIFGLNLGVQYAGFDFSLDFNGVSGNKIINSKKMARFNTPNFETTFLNHWTPSNTNTNEPRITNGGHNFEFSDRFIEDGSFIRIRTIQLGYTVPKNALSVSHLTNFRVYVNLTNPITWTKYSGYTPEIISISGNDVNRNSPGITLTNNPLDAGIDRGVYPVAKVITVGLNVSF